jgi:purine-binding chemotaxis protein CheW
VKTVRNDRVPSSGMRQATPAPGADGRTSQPEGWGARVCSASSGAPALTFLVFDVSGQACALGIEAVRRVLLLPELSPPATETSLLAGFLHLGRSAIAVLHLSRLLGLPDRPCTLYTSLIMLNDADCPHGLIVESVRSLVTVPRSALVGLPGQHVADEALTIDGALVAILNPKRLLEEQERRAIAALHLAHVRRLAELQEAGA